MRDQHYCYIRLEYPFEEYPCFKVRQIVVCDDQLNQLITCNECENHTGNRHNRIIRNRLHQVENTRREIRRACCYICSYTSNLGIDTVEGSCQQAHQPIYNPVLEPRGHLLKYSIHAMISFILIWVAKKLANASLLPVPYSVVSSSELE